MKHEHELESSQDAKSSEHSKGSSKSERLLSLEAAQALLDQIRSDPDFLDDVAAVQIMIAKALPKKRKPKQEPDSKPEDSDSELEEAETLQDSEEA